jgi:hypothetical protein
MPQYEVTARIEGITPYFSAVDETYADALKQFPSHVLKALNVRFAVLNPLDLSPALARRSGFQQIGTGFWLKDFGARPRAFLVDGAQAVTAPRAHALLSDPSFDVWRTALLEPAGASAAARLLTDGTGDAGTAELLPTRRPERISAVVVARRDALLLVSSHWDGGWRALVDGQPAPVARADFTIVGVPVPPGRHRVDLSFEPEGLRAGVMMLAAGLFLCGAWGALRWRRPLA